MSCNIQSLICYRERPAREIYKVIDTSKMLAPAEEPEAIQSASHGAGRQMSRTQAKKEISKADFKAILKDHNVTLIGAGLDEAPMAYKDIHQVMEAQKNLIDVVATFTPKMVRMADDGSRED